jgi:hypothetical protein
MPTACVAVGTTITAICSVDFEAPIALKNMGPATVYLDFQIGAATSAITADQASTGGYPLAPEEETVHPAHTAGSVVYTVYARTAEGTAYVSAIGC